MHVLTNMHWSLLSPVFGDGTVCVEVKYKNNSLWCVEKDVTSSLRGVKYKRLMRVHRETTSGSGWTFCTPLVYVPAHARPINVVTSLQFADDNEMIQWAVVKGEGDNLMCAECLISSLWGVKYKCLKRGNIGGVSLTQRLVFLHTCSLQFDKLVISANFAVKGEPPQFPLLVPTTSAYNSAVLTMNNYDRTMNKQ